MADQYEAKVAKLREECKAKLAELMKNYPKMTDEDLKSWTDKELNDFVQWAQYCLTYGGFDYSSPQHEWLGTNGVFACDVSYSRRRLVELQKQQEEEKALGVQFVSAAARAKEYKELMANQEKADQVNKQRYDAEQLRLLSDWMNETKWEDPEDSFETSITLWTVPYWLQSKLRELGYNVRLEQLNPHQISQVKYKTSTPPAEFTRDCKQNKKGWEVMLFGKIDQLTVSVKNFR